MKTSEPERSVDEFISFLRERLKAMEDGDQPAGRNYEDTTRAIELAQRFQSAR